jgi:hypothetical protein
MREIIGEITWMRVRLGEHYSRQTKSQIVEDGLQLLLELERERYKVELPKLEAEEAAELSDLELKLKKQKEQQLMDLWKIKAAAE